MNIEMQIILEVSNQAENFYEDALMLGDHAAYALKAGHRSQMTGLENIAESALKASDVLDYVKRQTARFSYWRQDFPHPEAAPGSFGERLKVYLEVELAKKRDVICKDKLKIGNTTDEDRRIRRKVYLSLMRQFLRNMIAQYEYRVSFDEKSKKGA
ncbi:MAG: hypothetical protein JO011_04720 [Ktedonobacteraceae bacterium]|nr:hypothetical protein [Ktedonobacteraceae bacterium]